MSTGWRPDGTFEIIEPYSEENEHEEANKFCNEELKEEKKDNTKTWEEKLKRLRMLEKLEEENEGREHLTQNPSQLYGKINSPADLYKVKKLIISSK